jgi:hypothetical protein
MSSAPARLLAPRHGLSRYNEPTRRHDGPIQNDSRPIADEEKLAWVIASIEELQRAAGDGIPPVPSSGKRPGCKSPWLAGRQEVSTVFTMPFANSYEKDAHALLAQVLTKRPSVDVDVLARVGGAPMRRSRFIWNVHDFTQAPDECGNGVVSEAHPRSLASDSGWFPAHSATAPGTSARLQDFS